MAGEACPGEGREPASTSYPGECNKDVDADLRRHDGGVTAGASLSAALGIKAPLPFACFAVPSS